MNSRILLTVLLALAMIFSVGAIQASDVNMTDYDALTSDDDEALQIEEDVSEESANSNTLSTNEDETSFSDDVKNSTEVTSPTNTIYYKGSYSVTLKDSNSSQAIANKTVNFIINNVNYNAKSDDNGVVSIDLSLNPGKYTVIAYFEGDNTYLASDNYTSSIQVLSTVKASDITKYYKGSAQYSATFYDSFGHVLANRNVVITVGGKAHKVKTDSKGVALLAMDLMPGTYKVVATDPITGYKLTTSFKVLSTISASNVKKVVNDKMKFKAKFFKSNGKPLANKKVKFILGGKTYKVTTNSNGVASLSLKNLKKGTYKIVCYNKDGLSKTYKIKVYNKVSTKLTTDVYTFLKGDNKKIKATLVNGLGYALPSGKLIKIAFNGKTYYKKTDSKGAVYLKLPSLKKGVYTVKYKFYAEEHYKASSASSKVVVISTSNPKLTVKSVTNFGYGAGTPFKVAVSAGGVPLIKKAVTFKINNKVYTKTTDNNGIASLPINLKIGNYTIYYSIAKDSKVNAKSDSKAIAVKQRIASTLTWKSGVSFSQATSTFKVLLKDANGKAVSGQTVKLVINSKTYTATTASNGYATFHTSPKVGTYNVSVKFAGSNGYFPSSTSKSVTITVSKFIKGVYDSNTINDLSDYLKSSKNCQVGNSKIKAVVKSLTNGLTSDYDKAKAIFNYARDAVSYSFYYDTKYGAVGTLSAKKGNCVDHAHLLVAMYRTAGLAARYVHGTCSFSSGGVYGHVWAQVLIGNTWVCADASSCRNSFGKIVNWNTKSYTLKSTYSSLPF